MSATTAILSLAVLQLFVVLWLVVRLERLLQMLRKRNLRLERGYALAFQRILDPISIINWCSEMLIGGEHGDLTIAQLEFVNKLGEASRRIKLLLKELGTEFDLDLSSASIFPTGTSSSSQ